MSTLKTTDNLAALYRDMAFDGKMKARTIAQAFPARLRVDSGPSREEITRNSMCLVMLRTTPTSTIYGCLGRVLMWLQNEGDALVVFEQQLELIDDEWQHRYVICDSCQTQLTLATGRLICKNCLDGDLCRECYSKYDLDDIEVEKCQDHTFLASPSSGWCPSWHGIVSSSGETFDAWLRRLAVSLKP